MSTVKKNSAILKQAMTDRHARWSKKQRYSKSKPHWRSPAGEDAGQSSHDKWKSSKPQGKWKEISLEMDALESALKEKTHTWNKTCKENAKRESELYKMVELAAIDKRQEDKERSMLKDVLKKLRKRKRRGKRGEPLKPSEDCARSSRKTCINGAEKLEDQTTSAPNSGK